MLRWWLAVAALMWCGSAWAGGKIALVVGNEAYLHATQLKQAPQDAKAVAAALKGLGFTVTVKIDAENAALQRAVADFGIAARGADVAFFYYAGHGVQVDGENYLVPIDATLEDPAYVDAEALTAQRVMNAMDAARSALNVVVLDACRNNPFVRSWSGASSGRAFGERGLDRLTAPPSDRGVLLALATDPGEVAQDSGVYARSLAMRLQEPCTNLPLVFAKVRDDVASQTEGAQRPWLNNGAGAAAYGYVPAGCAVEPGQVVAADGEWFEDPVLGRVRHLPGATFLMGSPETEKGRQPDEGPQHEVTLSGYWIMESEVTQAMWKQVMGTTPSAHKKCPECPVENVTWDDAVAFARAVSGISGYTYRLPTEAEWEYAARGGEAYVYAGSSSLDKVAWHDGNSGNATHPVCRKQRNGFGLCDMSGNVWEWTADWIGDYPAGPVTDPLGPDAGSDRVNRGGSWVNPAGGPRVSNRNGGNPSRRYAARGLRLARSE